MMSLLRLVMMLGLVVFGAIALFLGAVVTYSALSQGVITYSFGTGADAVSRTIVLAEDPSAFWKGLALLGMLPIAVGILGVWWGRRQLRS